MAPATEWARGAGERTDLDASGCAAEDCTAPAGLTGTVWGGSDDNALAAETVVCAAPDECASDVVGVESDAILRGRPLFLEDFSLGAAQSIGFGSSPENQGYGRYNSIDVGGGSLEYHLDGGREGGGHVRAVGGRALLRIVPPLAPGDVLGDPFFDQIEGTGEVPPPQQQTVFSTHDLDGRTLTGPETLQRFWPHALVQVMPDLTVRVVTRDPDTSVLTEIGVRTAYMVPATGVFSIETQFGLSPHLYNRGGFVLSNLYTEGGLPVGVPIVRMVGVRTRPGTDSSGIAAIDIGVPEETKLCAIVLAGAYGTRREYLYDALVAPAVPSGPGESSDSTIHHTHHENLGLADGVPLSVGMDLIWGVADRWRNVRETNQVPTQDLRFDWLLGDISSFDGSWDAGPFYPPTPDTTRVQLHGGDLDLYAVTLDRVNVLRVRAVAPYILAGVRVIGAIWNSFPGFGGRAPWYLTGDAPPHAATPELDFPHGNAHAAFRLMLRSVGGTMTEGRVGKALLAAPSGSAVNREWRPLPGYSYAPNEVLIHDPETSAEFTQATLPQVGPKAVYDFLDAIEGLDPADRYAQVDVAQAGLRVLYHKVIVDVAEAPPRPPIAELNYRSGVSNPTVGLIAVYCTSVDFNGGIAAITSGIVTRSIDWGDGSDPELLPGTGSANSLSHTYKHGTWVPVLTVTDADGLTDSATVTIPEIPLSDPVAAFSFTVDPDDPDALTVIFADSSSNPTGVITGWLWNFGDGSPTSALQNPTHVYAATGTYPVTLTVTDDASQTDAVVHNVVLTGPGGGYVEPGTARTMTFDMSDDFSGSAAASRARWGYVNTAAAANVWNVTGGVGGSEGGEEHDPGGPNWPAYWESNPPVPHDADMYVVARFNLAGKTIAANVQLIQGYPTLFALVLTTARKLEIWVDNGSGVAVRLGISATAIVQATGYGRIDFRGRASASGTGMAWVRYSTNPAVAGQLVEMIPDIAGPNVFHFDSLTFARGGLARISLSNVIGTGSSNGDWPMGTWPGHMIDGVQWDNVFMGKNMASFGDYDWASNT